MNFSTPPVQMSNSNDDDDVWITKEIKFAKTTSTSNEIGSDGVDLFE